MSNRKLFQLQLTGQHGHYSLKIKKIIIHSRRMITPKKIRAAPQKVNNNIKSVKTAKSWCENSSIVRSHMGWQFPLLLVFFTSLTMFFTLLGAFFGFSRVISTTSICEIGSFTLLHSESILF